MLSHQAGVEGEPSDLLKGTSCQTTQFLWEAAEETGVVQFGEEELRGDLIAPYSDLKGRCGEVGVGLFSQVMRDRMRESGLKLCQGRFGLDI